jgi:spore maturation protein CgeB
MRMLMTGVSDPNALEPCYARGLSDQPCELASVILGVTRKSGWRGQYRRLLLRFMPHYAFRQSNVRLLQEVAASRPDVVWVFKGMEIYPKTLRALKEQGITLINYNPDHPFRFFSRGSGNAYIRRSVQEYDLHLTYSQRIAKELRDRYPGIRVAIIPFGHDVSGEAFARISCLDEILRACFVGSPDKHRRHKITELVEAGIATDVYGPGWERFLKPSTLLRIHPAVRGEDLLGTLRRYRVQLNFFRPHNIGSHNMRSFEIPACGGLMLAEDSIEHRAFFESGEEAFFFADRSAMIDLASQILAMPKNKADRIRLAARNRSVDGGHSYKHRAQAALALITEVDRACRLEWQTSPAPRAA